PRRGECRQAHGRGEAPPHLRRLGSPEGPPTMPWPPLNAFQQIDARRLCAELAGHVIHSDPDSSTRQREEASQLDQHWRLVAILMRLVAILMRLVAILMRLAATRISHPVLLASPVATARPLPRSKR